MRIVIFILFLMYNGIVFASSVTAEGEALIENNDNESARSIALLRAKWSAVESVSPAKVKVESIINNSKIIDEAIKTELTATISSYDIIEEKIVDNKYIVKINANVIYSSDYASALGSDCAFFIHDRPMFGEGRGEILSPCDFSDLSDYDIKIISPEGISVSTAEAYGGIEPGIPDIPLREILMRPVSEWKDRLKNDFEKTVFPRHPALAAIKQSLYDSGAVYASMSGSGSSLFAIYPAAGK